MLAGGGVPAQCCLTAREPPPGSNGDSLEPFKRAQEGGWRTRDRAALLHSAHNTLQKLDDDFWSADV